MKKEYFAPSLIMCDTELEACLMAGSDISVTVQNDDFNEEDMSILLRGGNGIWDDEGWNPLSKLLH